MKWDYRVVTETFMEYGAPDIWYAIHKVYYDDEEGNPVRCSPAPVSTCWQDCDDISEIIKDFPEAFEKPYLWKPSLEDC